MKVSERKIYQADEVESFVKSSPEISKDNKRIIREPDIKVASVKISAYKPAL
ncbi:MAG: hypothetical protein KAW42_04045 [Candidatus Atribacteria bacterium]|nr:hypothetical protein [Candidatus Atribacteria bacterium]